MGLVMLYMLAGQIPLEFHVTGMGYPNTVVSQLWQFTFASLAAIDHHSAHGRRKELDTWIEEERVIAWNRITSNIGPVAGAGDGIIIASPSAGKLLTEPDYYVSPLVIWS